MHMSGSTPIDGARVGHERILNTQRHETIEARENRILIIQASLNERLHREMHGEYASKKDVSFELRSKVWFQLRGRPDYYKTHDEIDADLSREAALENGIAVPPPPVTAEAPKENVSIIQNLIKSADASKEIKAQLAQRGFDVDQIESLAIEAIQASTAQQTEESNAREQHLDQLMQELIDLATATPQIAQEMTVRMGVDLRLRNAISSASAMPKTSAAALNPATASAPSAIQVTVEKLDPIKILDILGFNTRFIPRSSSFTASVLQSGDSTKQVR